MPIIDPEALEAHILMNIERTEAALLQLPWKSILRRHRLRSELKRWRKALALVRGERPAQRRAGIIGRVIGGIIKG